MTESNIQLQQRSEDLISEEVKEIISYRPHWMIRRGNLVFLSILLLMILLTLFVKYPDVVNSSARIVALNAPKLAVARREGKITAIYIASGQNVSKGQHLALLETTADYKEVIQMKSWLQYTMSEIENGHFKNFTTKILPSFANLGDLQNAYQVFSHEWVELQQYFGSGYFQKKRSSLQQDLWFNAQLRENIGKQKALSRQERDLQEMEFSAYDSLTRDKLVAPLELNKYKASLLQKDQTLVQSEAQTISNDLASHNKQKELLDLQKQAIDQQQKFYTALLLLKNETEKWIQQYVVVAPENGTIFFVFPIQPNEQVNIGQELFYVQPELTSYYAQLMAGQAGLGKVKEGQLVKLKIENYPSEQYGYIKGIVTSISGLPNRHDSFFMRVALPDGLTTVYKKELFFRNNMLAGAEIITDDRRIFDRLFDPLFKLWQ